MGIRRTANSADHFTQISNLWVRDTRLSYKARGILSWLQSHSVGYRVDVEAIAAGSDADGRTAVRSGLVELRELGYLELEQGRNERGQLGNIDYVLTDPWSAEKLQVTPAVRKPDSGDQEQGNAPETPQVGTGIRKPDDGHNGQTVNAQVGTAVRFPDSGQPDSGSPDSGQPAPIRRTVKEEKNRSTPHAPRGAAQQTSLIVVEPGEVLPKITAATVAAAYVDAYKAAHDDATPPQTPARVGSDAKRLLKAGHDPAELLAAAALMGEMGLQHLPYSLQQLRKPQPAARNRAAQNDAVLRAELERAREADAQQTRRWGTG